VPLHRRLTVDAKGLAELLGIGLRTVRALDAGGKLPRGLFLAARKVWRVAEVRAWLAAGAPDRQTWEEIRRTGKGRGDK
jgi:hypothetical protein